MRYWTYAEIKDKVQKDLGLEDEDFVSENEILGYCNEAIDEAEGEIHTLYEDYFLDSIQLELINGQGTYDLPPGIFASKIRSIIYNDGSSIYPIRKFKEHKKFEKIAFAGNSDYSTYQYVLRNTILPIPPEPAAWEAYDILPWVSGQAYVPGTQVTEAGNIYECVEAYSSLIFSPTVPLIFEETFTDAGVLVFSDVTKAEVVLGILQQIDQRNGATFAAKFETDANALWSSGVGTGTLLNGAAVSGGTLNLSATNHRANWPVLNNLGALQEGTIIFEYTPDFTGLPSALKMIFTSGEILFPYRNKFEFFINTNGRFFWVIYNNAGGTILSYQYSTAYPFVSGTTIKFALCTNSTLGQHRLFANGTLQDAVQGGTGTRDLSGQTNFAFGDVRNASESAPGTYDNLIIYPTVLYTANHTPDYIIPDTLYSESYVTIPEWTDPELLSLLLAVATESQAHFTIRLSDSVDFLYHDGTAWTFSDSSYAQGNTLAELVANSGLLDLDTANGFQLQVSFPTGNTQGYIDVITATLDKYAWHLISAIPMKYEEEDLVRYLGVNYECATANSDLTFDPAKWTALAPYSTVPVPAVQLMLLPASQEDSTDHVTIWYIRNANRMSEDNDICDIPEFTSFVLQYIKVRCYEKEQNENLQFATVALEALRNKMITTLTAKEPDDNNEIEMDLSDYEDSTGV